MHPILIDLGPVDIGTYGVLLALGVILGLITLKLRADAAGLDGVRLVDFALWLVVWALLGSKLLLVLVELPRYLRDPGELVGLARAGGVFLGGVIAALLAAFILLRRYRLQFLPTMDVLVPSVALGHAVGRIGCLMAGCCWGSRCDVPWAVTYTNPVAAERLGTPLGVTLHPYPIYESMFNFLLYLGLAWLYRRRPAAGRVFAAYLMVYGAGRFALEWFRGDAVRGFVFGGLLSTSQLIAMVLVLTGAAIALWPRSAAPDR